MIKAVCFRINITECKPEPSIGKPDIVLQNKIESQDHSSQSIEIREKIKIINPLPNVDDLATSPIVKNTKILTNSSILQSSSLGNTAIHDQNYQKETSHLGIRNQSMKIHKVLELPLLPQLPNHIQEELNALWTPLEVIASPFKEAELLLSSNKS